MLKPLPALPKRLPSPWLACAVAALLVACGGGGKDSPATAPVTVPATSASSPATGTSSGTSNADTSSLPSLVLQGVAAVGAPLGGAAVSVIDATGALVGSGRTRLADGSYSITLSSKTPTGPLLLQARGVDAAGQPQLLHATVATPSAAMLAHLTPLTDAAVALALGALPANVFAASAAQAGGTGSAGNANAVPLSRLAQTPAAASFLKTLLKLQMGDLKLATTADLLADPDFAADKSAVDLLLEGVRVRLVSNAQGQPQLQLTSKLQVALTPEVVVDLASAQAQLAKTTGSLPANAISSSTKTTASYAAVLPNLAKLDELGAALNQLIGRGASEDSITSSALLAGYGQFDGRTLADLAGRLAGYASNNWQLGRLQVVGCADAVQLKGNCLLVQVAALVSDLGGVVRDQFTDVVSYSKTPAEGQPAWALVGNGVTLDFQVQPVAWLDRGEDGNPVAGDNPRLGVALLLTGRDKSGHATFQSATVQTPGGFSIALADCDQATMCLASQGGATSVAATGTLDEQLLRPAATGWLGGADTLRNARYVAQATNDNGSFSRTALLPADLPTTPPAATQFVALDHVVPGAPLTGTWLRNGLDLAWTNWAAAHPEMRVHQLRVVIRQSERVDVRSFAALPGITALTLPEIVPQDDQDTLDMALWLHARDTQGREWVTRYTIAP